MAVAGKLRYKLVDTGKAKCCSVVYLGGRTAIFERPTKRLIFIMSGTGTVCSICLPTESGKAVKSAPSKNNKVLGHINISAVIIQIIVLCPRVRNYESFESN